MSRLIVTGTSTDVGKTVVTAALAAIALDEGTVTVCKPAQTGVAPGEPGDLDDIRRLSGVRDTVELARYPDPLAPDTAARRSGLPALQLATVARAVEASTADFTLVEGAGGVLVHLGAGWTLIDLAVALDAPVLVVAAAGLGTLNHSALTVRALESAGLRCAGIAIGAWPAEPDLAARCNLDDLPRITGVDVVGRVPAGSGTMDCERFAAAAPDWFDSGWLKQVLAVG